MIIIRAAALTDPATEYAVAAVMEQGYIDALDLKQLRRSGDAVAVVILKLLVSKWPPSGAQTSGILQVFGEAFSDVELVHDPDQRLPTVSLFILRNLATATYSAKLKGEIKQTTDKLLAARLKLKAAPEKH